MSEGDTDTNVRKKGVSYEGEKFDLTKLDALPEGFYLIQRGEFNFPSYPMAARKDLAARLAHIPDNSQVELIGPLEYPSASEKIRRVA